MIRAKVPLFALAVFLLMAAPAAAGGIEWLSLDQARARQEAQYRPLFLYFHLPYCYRCKEMKQWVFSEEAVARAVNAGFWPVKLDLDQNKPAAERFKVSDVPSYLFLGPKGRLLKREYGVIRKEAFIKLLRGIPKR